MKSSHLNRNSTSQRAKAEEKVEVKEEVVRNLKFRKNSRLPAITRGVKATRLVATVPIRINLKESHLSRSQPKKWKIT